MNKVKKNIRIKVDIKEILKNRGLLFTFAKIKFKHIFIQ